MLSNIVSGILEWIYPLFKRLMPKQTFMYAACGGGNTLLGILIFSVCENVIFKKQLVHLPFITMKSHKAAMIVSFLVTFPIGFYLARFVVFSKSTLRGRHQLIRYFSTAMGSLFINYINLSILVDMLHFYPTVSQVINTFIVVIFSYLMQKYFAFKATSLKH